MRAQVLLPVLVGIIATSGCDLSAPGSAGNVRQVIIDPTSGQTGPGAQTPPPRLAVVFEQSGNGGVLSPAKTIGDETVWVSDDLASLTDRQGIVVSAQGVGSDLVSVETPSPAAWDSLPAPRIVPVIHRHFSDARGPWIRTYLCEVSPTQTMSVPRDGRIETARETRLSCRNADHSFENAYWRDRYGNMLQSRQWLGDQIGYASLQFPVRHGTAQTHAPGDLQ